MSNGQQNETLYMFLDKGGNFDFSHKGTKFFTITCLILQRPFPTYERLTRIKYDLLEKGLNLQYFHATEDKQMVRDQVFGVIQDHLGQFIVDSVIIEKRKTNPVLWEKGKFYVKVFGFMMKWVLQRRIDDHIKQLLIFTDEIPMEKDRQAIEKGIKTTVSHHLGRSLKYHVYHHPSKSNFNLQVADYINWAIYRKWERDDLRSYDLVNQAIRGEADLFKEGTTIYY